jgi:hypothetical protein
MSSMTDCGWFFRRLLLGSTWGSALLAVACGPKPAPAAAARAPAIFRQSDKSGRESVSVTIYNQNFGVVRETRRLSLGKGLVELSFGDVSASIQPETVRVSSLTRGALFNVLEQNYRYDLLTPAKLLEKYLGKQVTVYRYNEQTGTDEAKVAEVLSVEGGVTLRIDGQLTTSYQGRFAFKDVPPNLLQKPTLVWLLDSDRAEQRVEVTYLTHNLNWRADYVLKLDPNDQLADLNGWVTLDNKSGTSYENAVLRLVAGDVNRVLPPAPPAESMLERDDAAGAEQPFRQENLFEYQLYSLERPTSILDKETKQVSLFQAEGVAVKKKLVFQGEPYYFRGRYAQLATNQKVGVFIELVNSEKNRLGMPLPKGTVRLYKADASGALQFVGEDAIDHTPRDEKLELKVGDAFDVVGDRVQQEFAQVSSCVTESAYVIELRNHKDADVEVELDEPAGGEWELISHSQPFVKVDAESFRFDVKVAARGATKVSYRIRVRYC